MKLALFIRILSLLSSLSLIAADHSDGSCSTYSFLNEPPEELACNPYLDPNLDTILLKCSITGPKLPNDSHVDIEWFRTLEGQQGRERLSDLAETSPQLVTIDSLNAATSNGVIKTSILNIKDAIENEVAGTYWCVVIVYVDVSEVSHLEFRSEKSNVTTIRRATELLGDGRVCESAIQTTVSTDCVSFQVLPPDPLPGITSSTTITASETSGSPTSASRRPRTQGDDPQATLTGGATLLSTSMIIILSAVGGVLCLVIHVLLALVSGLCIKNRKKKRVRRGILDHRKVSSVSLLSTPPSQLPSPEAPQRSLSKDTESPTKPLPPITNTQLSQILKPLPPVPTCKPPILQNRTLPSRSTQQVIRSPPANCHNVMTNRTGYQIYAPPRTGHGPVKARAATFAGEFHNVGITPDSDSSADSGAEEDRKYKSLDRSMMDNYQPYEDIRAGIRKGDWDAYNDDNDDIHENDSGLENPYTTAIAHNTVKSNNYSDTENGLETSTNMPTVDDPSFEFTTELPSLRAKSSLLAVTNLPLARQSVDGEYVLPNEAFSRELLSPTQENELPDYIEIA